MTKDVLAVAAATTVISAAVPVAIVPWLKRMNRYDIPGHRSSHTVPVPRGGGLGLVVAVVGGALVTLAAVGSPHLLRTSWPVFAVSLAMAALGVGEDFVGLPILHRLVGQATVATAGAVWIVLAEHASALWLVPVAIGFIAYVNVANFMDGINGISSLHGTVAAIAYFLLARGATDKGVTLAAAVLFGCCIGFLPWNSPRARLFLGDSGSYLIGAFVCGLGASLLAQGVEWERGIAPASVYVADVAWTLFRRRREGERLTEAHRSHAYQRLSRAQDSHLVAAATVSVATVLVTLLATVGSSGGVQRRVLADSLALVVLVAYCASPRLPARRHAPGPGAELDSTR